MNLERARPIFIPPKSETLSDNNIKLRAARDLLLPRLMSGEMRCKCAVARTRIRWQYGTMKTLAEIKRAVEELPSGEKTELLLFVAQRLREEQTPLPEPRDFSDEQLQAWMNEDEEAMRRFRSGA